MYDDNDRDGYMNVSVYFPGSWASQTVTITIPNIGEVSTNGYCYKVEEPNNRHAKALSGTHSKNVHYKVTKSGSTYKFTIDDFTVGSTPTWSQSEKKVTSWSIQTSSFSGGYNISVSINGHTPTIYQVTNNAPVNTHQYVQSIIDSIATIAIPDENSMTGERVTVSHTGTDINTIDDIPSDFGSASGTVTYLKETASGPQKFGVSSASLSYTFVPTTSVTTPTTSVTTPTTKVTTPTTKVTTATTKVTTPTTKVTTPTTSVTTPTTTTFTTTTTYQYGWIETYAGQNIIYKDDDYDPATYDLARDGYVIYDTIEAHNLREDAYLTIRTRLYNITTGTLISDFSPRNLLEPSYMYRYYGDPTYWTIYYNDPYIADATLHEAGRLFNPNIYDDGTVFGWMEEVRENGVVVAREPSSGNYRDIPEDQRFTIESHKTVSIDIAKIITSSCVSYVRNNPNYSLVGTIFAVVRSSNNTNYGVINAYRIKSAPTINTDGTVNLTGCIEMGTYSNGTFTAITEVTPTTTITYEDDQVNDTLVKVIEDTTATSITGYTRTITTLDSFAINSGITNTNKHVSHNITAENTPFGDPVRLQISKISNKTNNEWGSISPVGARYTVNQYADAAHTTLLNTWVYGVRASTKFNKGFGIDFQDPTYLVSGNPPTTTVAGITYINWPLGYYTIQETSAPSVVKVNDDIISLREYDGGGYGVFEYTGVTAGPDGVITTSFTAGTIETNAVVTSIDELNWRRFGIIKHDIELSGSPSETAGYKSQGGAILSGATYGLYTTRNENFNQTHDDLGYTITSGSQNTDGLYPVLKNGQLLTITVDANGYQLSDPIPDSAFYVLKETVAPTGYKLDPTQYSIDDSWWNDSVESTTANGVVNDTVIRGNINISKKDLSSSTGSATGEGNLGGIYFAIVNNNANPIIMRNSDNVGVANLTIANGMAIGQNQVAAVVSTDNNGNATVNGLPYGNYIIYELRTDINGNLSRTPASMIGQVVDIGTGDYANKYYLYGTSTGTGETVYRTFEIKDANNDEIGDLINVNIIDAPIRVDFDLNKVDDATGLTPQGNASFADIYFAVVNNTGNKANVLITSNSGVGSTIWLPNSKNNGTNTSVDIANGNVIAILKTDANGYARINGLSAGSYQFIELSIGNYNPQDLVGYTSAQISTIAIGTYANTSYLYKASHNTSTNVLISSDIISNLVANITNHVEHVANISDTPIRKNISITKDITGGVQGSTNLSGIRYAIINLSANPVVMYTNDQAGTTTTVTNAVPIANGRVIAITTTDANGTATVKGLPIGTYQVVELRQDATIAIEDVYDGSTKLGTSIYANASKVLYSDDVNTSTISGDNDYTGESQPIAITYATSDNTVVNYTNTIARFGFNFYKEDIEVQHQQGNGHLNDIYFAIINTSANPVRVALSDNNTNTSYRFLPNVDSTVAGNLSQAIAQNYVVAVVKTRTNGTKEGFAELAGLPVGTYRVVELSAQTDASAQALVGTNNVPTTGALANTSYLRQGVLDINLTGENQNQTYVIGPFTDTIARGAINIQKKDINENGNTITVGDASLAGIRYAIVNRSENSVYMRAADSTATCPITTGDYAVGAVVAIATTDNTGKARVAGLPYGKYDVYELRTDSAVTVGTNAMYDSANKGTSLYANDSYMYSDHYDSATISPEAPSYTVAPWTNQLIETNGQEINTTFTNAPKRSGISFYKYDANIGAPEGNGNLNGIRFAVVNSSANAVNVKGNNDDRYVTTLGDTLVAHGRIVAVLTTYTKNGQEGYAEINGLPYGHYTIYELKSDAGTDTTLLNTTNFNAGSSKYSNEFYMHSDIYDSSVEGEPADVKYVVSSVNVFVSEAATTEVPTFTYDTQENTIIFSNYPARGNLSFNKSDLMMNHESGDSTFAGIKYAVVNRSTHPITMNITDNDALISDRLVLPIKKLTTEEPIGPWQFNPGDIVAICVTDNNGHVQLNGLPYGTYEIYELRMDSTWESGDTYSATSAKNGTSIYANATYIYSDNRDLEATVTPDGYTVASQTFNIDSAFDTVTTNSNDTTIVFKNAPVRMALELTKLDKELHTNTNQGVNTFAGIQFAVINRSDEGIWYKQDGQTTYAYATGDEFAKGEIVDILTLDENGYAEVHELPYGKYEIRELGVGHTLAIGDNIDDDWATKCGPLQYANTYYVYGDNTIAARYTVDAINHPTIVLHDAQGTMITGADDTTNIKIENLPVRGDIAFIKINDDIDEGHNENIMPYVPFLISHVVADANGDPILDANGDYQIIESHVLVTDANGHFNSYSRSKDFSQCNTLDQYFSNGAYSELLDNTTHAQFAATQNIWFSEKDANGNILTDAAYKNRGSLLYGTYVIQELRSDTNIGFLTTSSVYRLTREGWAQVNDGTDKILVDPRLTMESIARDKNGNGDVVETGANVHILDEMTFGMLRKTDKYRYETIVNVVDEHGVRVGTLTPKPRTVDENPAEAGMKYIDLSSATAVGGYVRQYHDTNELIVDTTGLNPGDTLNLETYLYQKIGTTWIGFPIGAHNINLDVEEQRLYHPTLTTEANNEISRLHIGTINPYTIVNDTITYRDFGKRGTYLITATIKDDNGNIVKDKDGKDCSQTIALITLVDATGLTISDGVMPYTYKRFTGPRSGSFTFDDLGITKFEIAPDYENLHIEVLVTDNDNIIKPFMITHNINRDDIDEKISYLQIGTTAFSVDGLQGVLEDSTTAHLIDKIAYSNLYSDITVKIIGTVVEKESQAVVTTKTMDAVDLTAGEGEVEMTFDFNSHPYAGKDLVVFEEIWYQVPNGELVELAEHKDIDDALQTVSIPKIQTNIVNNHVGAGYRVISQVQEHVTLVDTVSYTNLNTNYNWILTATLMDKNGNPVKDKNNNNVTATIAPFKPATKNGTQDVVITFDQDLVTAQTWENDESWVCFEALKSAERGHTDTIYTVHNDLTDKDQTLYRPKFRTVALYDTDKKQVPALPNQTVVDTITMKNFEKYAQAGDVFTLKIEAHDASDNSLILDSEGHQYVTNTFTWNGQTTEQISFTFDASGLLGKNIVFYETLYYGDSIVDGEEVLRENDITNTEQMITVPEIHTSVKDSNMRNATGHPETVSLDRVIIDTLVMNRITPDTDYVISTKLMDKSTNTFLKNDDGTDFEILTPYHSPATSINALIGTITGTVYAVDDTIDITIDLSAFKDLEGKDFVVYEEMPLYNKFYAEHKDINDTTQTIEIPKISTTFIDDATQTHSAAYGTAVTMTDTVAYENLRPNVQYTMTCTLWEKTSNAPFLVDGNPVVQSQLFTAGPTGSGTVDIQFTIDTTTLEGKKLVAYEVCTYGDAKIELAKHEDINDEGQTINVPIIRTTLIDTVIEDHMTAYSTTEKLVDTVTYANLVPGRKYKMVGTLMDKASETPITKDDGVTPITTTVEFIAGPEGFGEVEVEFEINSVRLAGHHVVAYEDCYDYDTDVLMAIHADINDLGQDVGVPEIQTLFIDTQTGIHLTSLGSPIIINDVVEYKNLLIGHQYIISGILMDKETEAPILDAEGNQITSEVKFVATVSAGTELVPFEIDTEFLKGHTLVAFEELTYVDKNKVVARHHDLTDANQTIEIPEIHTTLLSDDTAEHVAPVVDSMITLTDTVYYSHLVVGEEYTINGVLVDKKTGAPVNYNGGTITASKTFTATTSTGYEELTFTFNSSVLAGTTLVAFEDLEYNNVLVATHSQIDDEEQTVDLPNIGTSFFDVELLDTVIDGEVRSGQVKPSVTLKDIVSYTNLNPAYEYVVTGTLMYKDGTQVLVDGNPITSSTTFTPTTRNGSVEVIFNNVNTELFEGKTLVAFETLTRKNIEIITHADVNDVDQTIQIPDIHTTLVDAKTGDEVVSEGTETKLIDTVAYENLIIGKEYTVKGTLIFAQDYAEDGITAGDAVKKDGIAVTGSTTFVAPTTNGTIDVEFIIDSTILDGKTIVAFETLEYKNHDIKVHADITDVPQTNYVPEIHTTLLSDDTNDHIAPAVGTITLTDTVAYKNLVIGKEYRLDGILMDKSTGTPALVDGVAITGTTTFTPDTTEGTVDVTFTFDSVVLAGTTLVAFETLYHNGVIVDTHTDINDVEQTVEIPDIGTTFFDKDLAELTVDGEVSQGQTLEKVTLIDTVKYEHLLPGFTYKVEGFLMDKDTNTTIAVSSSSVTFVPTTADGTVDVTFADVDTWKLANKEIVAFETLSLNGVDLVIHHDINDVDETIKIPEIHTTFFDKLTGDNVVTVGEEIELVDTVKYYNLIVGKTYTINGTLMDKETGTPILDKDSNKITATTTFTATTEDGSVDVIFKLNTDVLQGKTLVAFESLEYSGKEVTTHNDITDEEQTVYVPKIGTTFLDSQTGDHVSEYSATAKLIDTVAYENLVPGKTYSLTSTVIDKATGLPLVVSGEAITINTEFIPTEKDGTIDIEFTLDTIALEGKTLVVFESLHHNAIMVVAHADINDEGQTIRLPKIRTTLVDSVTSDHVAHTSATTKLIDTIAYDHLLVGKEYTVSGTLMSKETSEVFKDANGNPITSSKTFTATTESGTIDIVFEFDSSLLEGKTLVAFEDVTYKNIKVAVHADITDENQTVHYPKISTKLISNNTGDEVGASGSNTLTDTVYYENLVPGKEYVMEGTIMYKSGTATTLTGSTTFTPTEANGSIDVKITGYLSSGSTYVAYETLKLNGHSVADHTDINDANQTVYVPSISTSLTSYSTYDRIAPATGTITLVDSVSYSNVVPGRTYSVSGTLMDRETGLPLTINGYAVTGSSSFTATSTSGSTSVTFTFDSSSIAGKSVVAFETMYHNGAYVASHSDINDTWQTVKIPNIKTSFFDKDFTDLVVSGQVRNGKTEKSVTLVDTVTYTNLLSGLEYTLTGTLMDKVSNTPILVNGSNVTATATFTPSESNGTVDVVFSNIDTSALAGRTLVAFETLTLKSTTLVEHKDINDVDQTIKIPSISTVLTSEGTNDHVAVVGESVTLNDKVSYSNLVPGKEYTLVGSLVSYTDDSSEYTAVMYNGEPVVTEVKFTPTTESGKVDVSFTVNTADLTNKTIVAFETLKYGKYTLVDHSDVADKDQTVYVPEIHTVAIDEVDEDKYILGQSEEETVVDTLYYKNLVPGETYTVTGKLVVNRDYADGEELEYVKVGKKVLTEKLTFTPETSDGEVELSFTFNASTYSGYKLVVVEEITHNGVTIITHDDIEDVDQTVEVSLILHVRVAKMDMDNIKYMLQGAEITIFNEDGTIAKDLNGDYCIGVTDENGEVEFSVIYDRNNKYYAMETKAPAGYQLCNDKFELEPSMDRETLGTCLIPIQIRDRIIIIPPKTGDSMPIVPITVSIIICILLAGVIAFKPKKIAIRNNTTTTQDSNNESKDED